MNKLLIKKLGIGSRKGFTLIEVIVVLVILAILAAIAIPALTGYIDEARKRSYVGEVHSAKVALQTAMIDVYSNSSTGAEVQNAAGFDSSDSLDAIDMAPYDWVTIKPAYADTWATMSSIPYDQIKGFADDRGHLMGLIIFYYSNGSDDADGYDAVVTYGFDLPTYADAFDSGEGWPNDEQYHTYTGSELEEYAEIIDALDFH
ncbi:MAG: prepilin-type N-terminal cleavage/methylation domain-containing protein [Clostridiales Family XIII bacterium]|jgi:prepilin-type N-terminal cleavage/methylation domain-containing protein|nr:prepilin-type N-terminal cleavage/methylation domain-containing protein [Clostridiales Family XIII bacterium]